MRLGLKVAALIATGCTAGCGGGSGGGGNAPPPTYSVGGTVSGLTGAGLVIQLNGGADLSLGANAPFNFATLLTAGAAFGVAVLSQPASQTCVVNNGSGLMPAANVTNVAVNCSALAGFSIAGLTDPLASQQWHLRNTGLQNAFSDNTGTLNMDINVDPVFGLGYTGAGVTVAVVDSGLEIAHEDLAANVVLNGSWNFNNNTTDPTNTVDTDGDHGTSVAGLIAMARNTVGGIGVAPSARLKGFNFLGMTTPTETAFLDSIGASGASPNSKDVFVFNQSFGISTVADLQVDTHEEDQYRSGVTLLRGGKGALYVKAAGNGFAAYTDTATGQAAACGAVTFTGGTFVGLSCENASMDPENTLPYQIVVGAINATGVRSTYSTAGSAIWVSAPGGEFGHNQVLDPAKISAVYSPAMVTADQSGCAKGLATTTTNNLSAFDNGGAPNGSCNYTNAMNGTSSATPVTAGVIALMLEANPALTWRDVKHIFASTARQIDAARAAITVQLPNPGPTYVAEPAWTPNAAGFKFHNWYGFGMVDASAAVNMAKTYAVNLGMFSDTGFIVSAAALGLAIPDDSATGVTAMLKVNVPAVQFVEAVQIRVNITHPFTGDLGVELSSPQGTRSVLKTIRDGFAGSADLTNMVLLSNAFYGENPTGTWTIKVVDGNTVDTGTLNNWAIRVYGH
jgi:subtilisin-like proprotein convertase family protein/subtilisin family serine protease